MMVGIYTPGPMGIVGLEALYGMGADLPPIGVCKDASGNLIDCGQAGTGGPCDPTFVAMGYTCYVDAGGQVTYVGPNTPAPAPGGAGTGTQGSSTGAGGGTAPAPGGKPPAPPSSWKTWLLAAAVLVLAAKAAS